MAINELRTSQLITTFGTGAMVDLPNDAAIIGGPDHWTFRQEDLPDLLINEPRLNRRVTQLLNELFDYGLSEVKLMRPPAKRQTPIQAGAKQPQVVAWTFPEWFVVQDVEHTRQGRRRRLVNKYLLNKGQYRDESGKRHKVVPIRFVRACEHAHVDDVDWSAFVHGAEGRNCPKARGGLFLVESGSSGGLADVEVVCPCGARRSLAQAGRDPTTLGSCNGRRPWLGRLSKTQCGRPSKLLVRSASNAYFAQLYSVISIPEGGSELEAILQRFETDLTEVKSQADLEMAIKFNQGLRQSLTDYEPAEVFAALTAKKGGTPAEELGTKSLEFAAFTGPESSLGKDHPDAHFFIRHLDDTLWKKDRHLAGCLQNVVLVERLREIVAQVGFTRFESGGKQLDGELDLELDITIAQLAKDRTDVVPSMENRGEGFFLHFDPDHIEAWMKRPEVRERARQLHAGYVLHAEDREIEPDLFFGPAYYFLHTFAHLLIQAVSMECGYPASSLKERIYCDNANKEFGILIYTGSSDAEGTLGGLVHAARRIGDLVARALDQARICSSDPVCAHSQPAKSNPSSWLQGSACHSCTHVPETCCEQMNRYLDRALVVDTVEGLGCAFYEGSA